MLVTVVAIVAGRLGKDSRTTVFPLAFHFRETRRRSDQRRYRQCRARLEAAIQKLYPMRGSEPPFVH